MFEDQVKTYSGTPREIIIELAKEVTEALSKQGIGPNGANIIAMMHALACSLGAKDMPQIGKMPSFGLMLAVFRHGYLGSDWSSEEIDQFNQEISEIVLSLGGVKLDGQEQKIKRAMIVSPMSKEVH